MSNIVLNGLNGDNIMRVIDALQLSEVLNGSKWFRLPVPVLFTGGTRETIDHDLPMQTIGIDPARGQMYWCGGIYDVRAAWPSHFSGEAALPLRQLLGECALIDAKKGP